ncbi:MAG: histidine phosphatase family protein [Phormidesmis sp.]
MLTRFALQHAIQWKRFCGVCLSLILVGCATTSEPVSVPSDDSVTDSRATDDSVVIERTGTEELETERPVPERPVSEQPISEQSVSERPISGAGPSSAVSVSSEEEAIWAKLAQAENETYVVLMRHAIAPGTGDPANFQLDDCSTQRNLSEEGRQQAIEIGETFRRRNIPVTQVLSSQWCRCLETAELMDLTPVDPFPPLNSFFRDRSTADTQAAQVKDYIAANQDSPGVIIMVTHQVNVTGLSDVFPSSGSAVVVELNGDQLDILGQILEPS